MAERWLFDDRLGPTDGRLDGGLMVELVSLLIIWIYELLSIYLDVWAVHSAI